MKLVKRILIGTAGAEIAETAVVLPLLFTVLLANFLLRSRLQYLRHDHAGRHARSARGGGPHLRHVQQYSPDGRSDRHQHMWRRFCRLRILILRRVQVLTPAACACGSVACGTPVACDPAGVSATPSICVQQNVIFSHQRWRFAVRDFGRVPVSLRIQLAIPVLHFADEGNRTDARREPVMRRTRQTRDWS